MPIIFFFYITELKLMNLIALISRMNQKNLCLQSLPFFPPSLFRHHTAYVLDHTGLSLTARFLSSVIFLHCSLSASHFFHIIYSHMLHNLPINISQMLKTDSISDLLVKFSKRLVKFLYKGNNTILEILLLTLSDFFLCHSSSAKGRFLELSHLIY